MPFRWNILSLFLFIFSSTLFGSPAFDGERVLGDVRAMVAIGRRPLGSENNGKAAAFIETRLRKLGYRVEERAFPVLVGFKDVRTCLAINGVAEPLRSAKALTYSQSASLDAEAVVTDSPLVDLGPNKINIRGKILVVPRGQISFEEKERRAIDAGAVCIIIYNSEPGSFAGNLETKSAIPTIGISMEDGRILLEQINKGNKRLHVDSHSIIDEGQGKNIIATSSGISDHVLIFGAHYDSVPNGVGANDNGSGIGILLELARVMAGTVRKDTLVFMFFDGEENGLLGSKAYVRNLDAKERHSIRAALIFDTVASPGEGPYLLEGSDELIERAWTAGRPMGIPMSKHADEGGSDEWSFLEVGIPTLLFYRRSGGLANTPDDTLDRVNTEWLSTTGRFVLALIDEP